MSTTGGGETREDPSGWTVDTLHNLVLALFSQVDARITRMFDASDLRYSQRFDAQQEAVQAALLAAKEAVTTAQLAQEKAVLKSETAADKRFDSVNEFRQQLKDQQALFVTRAEVDPMKSSIASFVTRTEMYSLAMVATAIGGLIGGLIGRLFH